jgi:hypothetical protein
VIFKCVSEKKEEEIVTLANAVAEGMKDYYFDSVVEEVMQCHRGAN